MNFSATSAPGQSGNESATADPLTVAEKSDFTSTSLSSEVVDFVDACAEKASHVNRFVWGTTVEGRDMIGAIVSRQPYALGDQDDRNVVLLLGNIHSGECAGKEALLMMLRDLTYQPDHRWLDNNVIIFAPNYNADGNDRVGKNNRPGQAGPVNGMGRRENAQQLDLNRDFCKIESPEARALVGLINKTNPHLFVDCHTTNGSKHQYGLTYDIPHNPATAESIRTFLRQKMMPVVTKRLADKGQLTFYYGNFNREHDKWTTYGHEPRYSTEYVGLRGRLAILSEAYSYLDYQGRIIASKDFVSGLLDYVSENHQAIHELLKSVDAELIQTARTEPQRTEISLSARVKPFGEKFTVKGFKDGQPHDYECDFVGLYESSKSTPMPFAYLLPASQARVVDRLKMHGVKIEKLTADQELEIEFDTVKSMDRSRRAFQKHKMVRVESERSTISESVPAGTYLVRTAQPLGRFISYMLESESDDGFAFWNFFDDAMEVDQRFPVMRIADPVDLQSANVDEIKKTGQIELNMIDGPDSLLAELPSAPQWVGNSNLVKVRVGTRDYLLDAKSASYADRPARPYRSSDVKSALIDAGFSDEDASALAQADPIVATNNRTAIFAENDHAIVYFTDGKKVTKDAVHVLGTPEEPGELFRFNDDESRIAFSTPKGLHFLDLDTREKTSVLAKHEKMLVGKLDWVYQEELYGRGNFKGYWWQTNGDSVAFLTLDETPLIPFTVMDHMPVRGKSEYTNYPKAGDPIPAVQIGVVDSSDLNLVTMVDLSRYDGEEILISRVTWSPDGKKLFVQVQNRVQTWLDLLSTDANGQNVKLLFRDQTPAWIESPGDPVFIANGEFLWRSPRSGYSHIYRYGADGKLIGAVTEGAWEVRSLIGTDPENKFCYFTAAKDNAIDLHCFRTEFETGKITQLTQAAGTHAVDFNHDFTMFIDSFSDVDTPAEHSVWQADGTLIRRLGSSSDDRLNYLDISKPEFMLVESGNFQPMDAMLIKPPNFDPNKKYPVLVHIYAGPQAPRVRNRFGGEFYLWHQMLAQQGYVVWMCDNQSASFRSAKQVWPIHRNMAENELKDIETGVKWLKTQSWVDADRIGIWGWSYGGYMTAYAMTHSQSFKMGISGAPVTDWKNYDAIYTERYMGLPQDNPDGYASTSVLYDKAKQLHGKLLLIHGTIDDNVHLNNTIQFAKELQYAGKQFEMMMYPSNRHSVKDKKQVAHLRKLMTDFVLDNL